RRTEGSTDPGFLQEGDLRIRGRGARDVSSYSGALEAIDRILNRGGDADDVLRQVVAVLYERLEGSSWVGISFVEGGELVLGPELGERTGEPTTVAISYDG